jgi:hypothetical protein
MIVAMKGCCCTKTSNAGAYLWRFLKKMASFSAEDRLPASPAAGTSSLVFENVSMSSRDGNVFRAAISGPSLWVPLHASASSGSSSKL